MPKYYGKDNEIIEIQDMIGTEDIHEIREGNDYPKWSDEQVKQWVESDNHEEEITTAMYWAAHEWISENIDIHAEEELELQEKE